MPSTGRCAGAPKRGRRAGNVLDLAGADVRRRRAARPRQLPRPGPRDLPRDGAGGHHHGRASSTTCTTAPTGRRTPTPTRWATRWSRPADRPGCGSCCWTPATSRPASAQAPEGVQRRFTDGTADGWAERVGRRSMAPHVGAAIHSVRAVPRDQLPVVADWASSRQAPLHVHLSEQVAENDECLAAYGITPTELLGEAGALGERTSAVHATHLTERDVAAARGVAHVRLLLPDHRARPRRRHRAVAAAARRGRPADAGVRQPRGRRPLRGDAGGGARRAARHPAAWTLVGGRPVGRRDP